MQEPLVSVTYDSFSNKKIDDIEDYSSALLKTAATNVESTRSVSCYVKIPIAPDEEESPSGSLSFKSALRFLAGMFFVLVSIGGGGSFGVLT